MGTISTLGWQTPSGFAATFHRRRELTPRQAKSSAPDPLALPAEKAKPNRQNKLKAR